MQNALNAMEKFIHADTELPALVRAGLIHYQFEAIHPFLDGNGRVGRLLMVLLLREWNVLPQPLLNLSVYFERYRQESRPTVGSLSTRQMGGMAAFLTWRDITSFKNTVFRINHCQGIVTRYEELVQTDRNPQRMTAMIDFIFSRPILTCANWKLLWICRTWLPNGMSINWWRLAF